MKLKYNNNCSIEFLLRGRCDSPHTYFCGGGNSCQFIDRTVMVLVVVVVSNRRNSWVISRYLLIGISEGTFSRDHCSARAPTAIIPFCIKRMAVIRIHLPCILVIITIIIIISVVTIKEGHSWPVTRSAVVVADAFTSTTLVMLFTTAVYFTN